MKQRPKKQARTQAPRATFRRRAAGALVLALGATLSTGCPAPPPRKLPPIQVESPRTEILRIGTKWQAVMGDKGFRSAPSQIGVFQSQKRSLLTLPESGNNTQETLLVRENFSMRNGKKFSCLSEAKRSVQVRFARRPKSGEAALELIQPKLSLSRQCYPAGFPNPVLVLPARTTRFALKGDQLVAYAPKTDKRHYVPLQ